MKAVIYLKSLLITTITVLLIIAIMMLTVDPCFHFHAPLHILSYDMKDSMQRYINDGIIKNYKYDSVITGTSMTANFRKTEFDYLFHSNSIKIPYSGGSFSEINEAVGSALQNSKVNIVVRCLDYGRLGEKYDVKSYSEYPEYLYDDDVFNDIKYIYNKEILLKCLLPTLIRTIKKEPTMSFDQYSNWASDNENGAESVLSKYTDRPANVLLMKPYTEDDRNQTLKNIELNVIDIARSNPDVTFYYFFSPYSILYFDKLYRNGELLKTLEIEEQVVSLLVDVDNIKLYSFNDMFELVCDLDNYMDTSHYSEKVSSMILKSLKDGDHYVNKENYLEYISRVNDFYLNFNYDEYYNQLIQ